MYAKCLPICLGGCMWVYACGSSASFPINMTYFQWMHNYLSFYLSSPSFPPCKIWWTLKDFNCNLESFYHCWLNCGPTDEQPCEGQDPAGFSDLPGRERLTPGMVKVVNYLVRRETRLDRRVAHLCESFAFSSLWWKLKLELMLELSASPMWWIIIRQTKATDDEELVHRVRYTHKIHTKYFSMRHSLLYFTRFWQL